MAKIKGSTEIRTRIAGFRVLSADHYTIEPFVYLPCKDYTVDRTDSENGHSLPL